MAGGQNFLALEENRSVSRVYMWTYQNTREKFDCTATTRGKWPWATVQK